MEIFGEKEKLAIEIGELNSQMLTADIWVAKKKITYFDNTHYIFALLTSLEQDIEMLKKRVDWFKYDKNIVGDNVESRFLYIKEYKDNDSLYDWYSFLDWGPPTHSVNCFFVPFNGKLYLTCEFIEKEHQIFGYVVEPYALTSTLIDAHGFINEKYNQHFHPTQKTRG